MATPSVFQTPSLNNQKRIPMKTIRAIAGHIAKKIAPEEIILFGSHAYGKPTLWSDVDLLVVGMSQIIDTFRSFSKRNLPK